MNIIWGFLLVIEGIAGMIVAALFFRKDTNDFGDGKITWSNPWSQILKDILLLVIAINAFVLGNHFLF